MNEKTVHFKHAKEIIEKTIYQFEDILKSEAMRLHHEEGWGSVHVSDQIGVPHYIFEKWLKEKVKHLHDVQKLTYEEISKIIKRSSSVVGRLYREAGNKERSITTYR